MSRELAGLEAEWLGLEPSSHVGSQHHRLLSLWHQGAAFLKSLSRVPSPQEPGGQSMPRTYHGSNTRIHVPGVAGWGSQCTQLGPVSPVQGRVKEDREQGKDLLRPHFLPGPPRSTGSSLRRPFTTGSVAMIRCQEPGRRPADRCVPSGHSSVL